MTYDEVNIHQPKLSVYTAAQMLFAIHHEYYFVIPWPVDVLVMSRTNQKAYRVWKSSH